MQRVSILWCACIVLALGCTRADPPASNQRSSVEHDDPTPEPSRAVAIVQTGQIQELHRSDLPRQYRYSEARYDRAGQLLERVTYRGDGTRAHVREYADGRIRSMTQLDDDGRTVDYVLRFVHDDADRLVEIRYCATAALDCPAWRVDVVETWTPEGLPLSGAIVKDGTLRVEWKYDAKGRLIEKRWATNIWSFEWDDQDHLVGFDRFFPNGDEGPRSFEYDDTGRVVRETRVDDAVIEYSYENLIDLQPGAALTGVEDVTQSYGSVD